MRITNNPLTGVIQVGKGRGGVEPWLRARKGMAEPECAGDARKGRGAIRTMRRTAASPTTSIRDELAAAPNRAAVH